MYFKNQTNRKIHFHSRDMVHSLNIWLSHTINIITMSGVFGVWVKIGSHQKRYLMLKIPHELKVMVPVFLTSYCRSQSWRKTVLLGNEMSHGLFTSETHTSRNARASFNTRGTASSTSCRDIQAVTNWNVCFTEACNLPCVVLKWQLTLLSQWAGVWSLTFTLTTRHTSVQRHCHLQWSSVSTQINDSPTETTGLREDKMTSPLQTKWDKLSND